MRGAGRQNLRGNQNVSGRKAATLPYHPDFSGPVRVLEIERPQPEDDESTTAQTVAMMAHLVREDSSNPIVRRAAYSAIAAAPSNADDETNRRAVVAAVHQWIRDRVMFVEDSTLAGFSDDPAGAEVLVRPIDLLTMPQPKGDCDDFSMLAAAMLRALGFQCAFRTVAAEKGNPNYSHVYAVVMLPSGAMPIDASHGPYAGWEAQAQGKKRDWPIEGPDEEPMQRTVSGLGVDYTSIIDTGINDAAKILGTRYAVPQLNEGQYIQQGNSVLYQAPAGSSGIVPLTTSAGGSSMLLLLGIGVVVLLLIGMKK